MTHCSLLFEQRVHPVLTTTGTHAASPVPEELTATTWGLRAAASARQVSENLA